VYLDLHFLSLGFFRHDVDVVPCPGTFRACLTCALVGFLRPHVFLADSFLFVRIRPCQSRVYWPPISRRLPLGPFGFHSVSRFAVPVTSSDRFVFCPDSFAVPYFFLTPGCFLFRPLLPIGRCRPKTVPPLLIRVLFPSFFPPDTTPPRCFSFYSKIPTQTAHKLSPFLSQLFLPSP